MACSVLVYLLTALTSWEEEGPAYSDRIALTTSWVKAGLCNAGSMLYGLLWTIGRAIKVGDANFVALKSLEERLI